MQKPEGDFKLALLITTLLCWPGCQDLTNLGPAFLSDLCVTSFSLAPWFSSCASNTPTLGILLTMCISVSESLPVKGSLTSASNIQMLTWAIFCTIFLKLYCLPISGPYLNLPCLCSVAESCLTLLWPPWTIAHQAPLSMGFPSKDPGVGCHFLLQGI